MARMGDRDVKDARSADDRPAPSAGNDGLDHSSRQEFFEHYAEYGSSESRVRTFTVLRDSLLRIKAEISDEKTLDVLDVGCNTGTLSILWAALGHKVCGIDINEPLLDLARKRATEAGHDIDFRLGTATQLPWPDRSFDICCLPELLEHVSEWETCIDECARILRPGGLLFISTSNYLCPVQQEFTLPLYSWYPAPLKRRYEKLAVTTRPELANHATYPAVNWFSYFSLRRELARRGFDSMDRFDIAYRMKKGSLPKGVLWCIRKLPGLRLLGQMGTQGTRLVAVKRSAAP